MQDRPWNDKTPRHGEQETDDDRPILKAVILDFSTVNNVDATSIQALIDVRNQLDRYAAPETVDWHFAHIENRWAKRGLAAGGFGFRTPKPAAIVTDTSRPNTTGQWRTIFSIADLGGSDSAAKAAERHDRKDIVTHVDVEQASGSSEKSADRDIPRDPASRKLVAVQGLNRPYFHFDLQEAVEAAVENARTKKH